MPHTSCCTKAPGPTHRHGPDPHALPGQRVICRLCRPPGQAPSTTPAGGTQARLQAPHPSLQAGYSHSSSQTGPPLLAQTPKVQQTPQAATTHSNNGDRCINDGVGGQSSFLHGQRTVVPTTMQPAHQLAGDDGGQTCPGSLQTAAGRNVLVSPDRQQDRRRLPAEGRGNPLHPPLSPGMPDPDVVPPSPDHHPTRLRQGDGQHHRGLLITKQGNAVAPRPGSRNHHLCPVRQTRSRPLCLMPNSTAPEVHDHRQERPPGPGSRRPQPAMELSVPVCLPPSNSGTSGGEQAQGLPDKDATDSPMLERRTLAPQLDGDALRHTPTPPPPAGSHRQRDHRLPSQEPGQSAPCGMATMRSATGLALSPSAFQTLQHSWRDGTRRQYQSAWKTWCSWRTQQSLDPATVSVTGLIDYLQHLVDRGMAWRTINVHRSAISTILQPGQAAPVGQHPLVCRFLRGVFNLRPPPVRVAPTWDVSSVLTMIAEWHPPTDITLDRLTKKVLFLLALCTAKRVSDLRLFSVDDHLCFVGESSIVLQTSFGSKTDRPSHRAPPVTLKPCADGRLCPVAYMKAYLARTSALRADSKQLFISAHSPHHPVKLPTIRRWLVSVLKDAGQTGSPGSTRATATTCAMLRGIPLQRIMNSADWTRMTTPLRHYLRVLPEQTLRAVDSQDIQQAVLHLTSQ